VSADHIHRALWVVARWVVTIDLFETHLETRVTCISYACHLFDSTAMTTLRALASYNSINIVYTLDDTLARNGLAVSEPILTSRIIISCVFMAVETRANPDWEKEREREKGVQMFSSVLTE